MHLELKQMIKSTLYNIKCLLILLLVVANYSCSESLEKTTSLKTLNNETVSLVILGTVQDGGSPHIACKKNCCKNLFQHPDPDRMVVSLGLIDPINRKKYLFEATPDISQQMKLLKELSNTEDETPDGCFLTHAHIGHYTGLMYLGKEALGGNGVPVYAMPKMKSFLEKNGPWDQLVKQGNISIKDLSASKTVPLSNELSITPFTVPHRDEYSETVGYKIKGPNKSALFIPDIDKWEKWKLNIIEELAKVDYAFLDATFYDGEEINNRDISEIPHPFVIESMKLFKKLSKAEKDKIYFIHFNHTNPALVKNSKAARQIERNGFHIATVKATFEL